MKDLTKVKDIEKGMKVKITDVGFNEVEGIVTDVLSSFDNKKGIKVRLESGEKGRIKEILNENLVTVNKVEKKQTINIKEDFTKPIVIDVDKLEIENVNKQNIIGVKKQFEVVTKFFQATYCKSLKSDIYGIVIFRVKALDVNMAVYKINLYLKKYCLTKDIKYEVIKINNN